MHRLIQNQFRMQRFQFRLSFSGKMRTRHQNTDPLHLRIRPDQTKQLRTVHAGHADIQDQQIRLPGSGGHGALHAVMGLPQFIIPEGLQRIPYIFAKRLVVVHHQNFLRPIRADRFILPDFNPLGPGEFVQLRFGETIMAARRHAAGDSALPDPVGQT